MTILGLLVGVVLAVICLWAINTYLPNDPPFRLIGNLVVIVILVVALLYVFGILGALSTPVPRAR